MAFGIGINTEHTEQEPLSGTYHGVLLVGALSPAQNIINDIASGIGMGMATVVVAFVGLVEVKNRLTKRRNKREDADQEKSDTE